MPRGYLKHSKNVGRRVSRGGGSATGKAGTRTKQTGVSSLKTKGKPLYVANDDLSDVYEDIMESDYESETSDYGRGEHTQNKMVKHCSGVECSICFDNNCQNLVQIMNVCASHPPACYDCLRQHYIIHGQEDVSNYPLRCFHPDCDRIVHGSQLDKHGLFRSNDEKTRHYRLIELAKTYKAKAKRNAQEESLSDTSNRSDTVKVAHCPFCDHPRRFVDNQNIQPMVRPRARYESSRVFCCKNCTKRFAARDTFSETINVVEAFKRDGIGGVSEGWVRCPKCQIIISKGDGCWHMTCVCGEDFYWDEEVEKKELGRKQTYELSKTLY